MPPGLVGQQPHAATPAPVQVVLTLLREKLEGAREPGWIAAVQRLEDRVTGDLRPKTKGGETDTT